MKNPRKIGRKRFLYLCSVVALLDSIVHGGFENEEFSSFPYIYDDEDLTKNVCELIEYARAFERKTGLKLEVNIDYIDKDDE
ncbi:MAG: hypothetical protein ACRDDY_03585 [Clostridium sp.]|uniref:hypothetical protein n=1 Tax=Clostridium sp. TaxID=1506 RepID=UPI003EE6E824